MNSSIRAYRVLALAVLLLLVLAGCGTSSGTTGAPASAATPREGAAEGTAAIKVGSKDFTEEFIVAEMYAQLLENAGFKVEKKLNLGGTPVAQAAITKGDIDLYPEYTSTGLQTVLKNTDRFTDAQKIFDAV